MEKEEVLFKGCSVAPSERLNEAGLLPKPGKWIEVWAQTPGHEPRKMILYHVPVFEDFHAEPSADDVRYDIKAGGHSILTRTYGVIALFTEENFYNYPANYNPYLRGEYLRMIRSLASSMILQIYNPKALGLNLYIWHIDTNPKEIYPAVAFYRREYERKKLLEISNVTWRDVIQVLLLKLASLRKKVKSK